MHPHTFVITFIFAVLNQAVALPISPASTADPDETQGQPKAMLNNALVRREPIPQPISIKRIGDIVRLKDVKESPGSADRQRERGIQQIRGSALTEMGDEIRRADSSLSDVLNGGDPISGLDRAEHHLGTAGLIGSEAIEDIEKWRE